MPHRGHELYRIAGFVWVIQDLQPHLHVTINLQSTKSISRVMTKTGFNPCALKSYSTVPFAATFIGLA